MTASSPPSDPADPRPRPGRAGWLLLAPMLLWLGLFVVAPAAVMLCYSFARKGPLGVVVWDFTLDNYLRLFRTPALLDVMTDSLVSAGLSTAICVVVGYPVAYYIGRAPARWRTLLLMAVMIPFWTNFLIRTYAWITILTHRGLLSGLLEAANLTSGPIDLMNSQTAVMIGLVYTYLPFMILPIYGSVEKLDGAMIEAAFDLGATPWRAFWRVIVPLTRPGIVAGVVLVFVPAIGQFAISDILGGRRHDLIGNVITDQFVGQSNDKPFGAALGVMLLAVFVVLFWLAERKRGLFSE